MSRSHVVYVLFDQNNHQEPIAGFTVKHEMLAWAKHAGGKWMYMRLVDNPIHGDTGSGVYLEIEPEDEKS